ncbi:uncharacterized protein PV09_01592 [Verruconis gallopava]|uniref:Borealin N-terminal domain-containing protein n=1 Tax=Verruconis gallopava TaxID=253628 RepID=A0A0D2AMF7_9PEZI|nr:uncharacterized protein PV09_01592 [Verruconis gallopava]KIW07650.1 hypothetical protein PV09_01592 [Verruconis gallopava]
MPPIRTRKDLASGTRAVAIQSPNTPTERESRQHAPIITQAQKQALIDNLQLEIKERARKLRAQYALHAQGLRSRLEMRINRIPQNLRNANIDDLIEKYAEHLEPPQQQKQAYGASKPTLSRTTTAVSKEPIATGSSPMRRGLKRDSSEMMEQSDKENIQAGLDMPKKRAKTADTTTVATAAGPAVPSRGTSRKIDPSKVLSPKSHNSRTYPISPAKASPSKPTVARSVSPIKPGTVAAATASLASLVDGPAKTTKSAASSRIMSKQAAPTGTVRGRGARTGTMAPPPVPSKAAGRGRAASQSSQTSDSSAQTTIVRKAGIVRKAVSKATGLTSAASKRTAGARNGKTESVPAPSAAGACGRTLRSRR